MAMVKKVISDAVGSTGMYYINASSPGMTSIRPVDSINEFFNSPLYAVEEIPEEPQTPEGESSEAGDGGEEGENSEAGDGGEEGENSEEDENAVSNDQESKSA